MSTAKRQALGKMFETVPHDKATELTEKRADRVGKRATLFQLPTAAKKQLAMLAIERETTQQALLSEALNDLFKKHGKPPIA
jgi:hypothetical protein